MYKYILFDLDGTLTDSAPGIIRCVQYALEKCGKGTCPDRELLPFIGPPLTESFQKVCGMTAAEANTALEYYRERFARVGMYENSVYDGIPELLQNLRQAGKTLAVATSKPQLYAEKILEHFGLAAHFSTIAGPGFNGELPTKADVISECCSGCTLPLLIRTPPLCWATASTTLSAHSKIKSPSSAAGYGYVPRAN